MKVKIRKQFKTALGTLIKDQVIKVKPKVGQDWQDRGLARIIKER